MTAVSDERDEMFRQDISQIEKSTVEMELKYFG
jgi:hypothetical protein